MEINKNYQLNNLAIDEISNEAEKYLTSIKMEKKNLLRIRLIIEEMFLDWQSFLETKNESSIQSCRCGGSGDLWNR